GYPHYDWEKHRPRGTQCPVALSDCDGPNVQYVGRVIEAVWGACRIEGNDSAAVSGALRGGGGGTDSNVEDWATAGAGDEGVGPVEDRERAGDGEDAGVHNVGDLGVERGQHSQDPEQGRKAWNSHPNGSSLVEDPPISRSPLQPFAFAGYTLFLALVIDRLHHYIRKLINLRRTVNTSQEEVENLKKEKQRFKEKEETSLNEIKKLHEEVASIKERLQKLQSESAEHEKRAETAEAHVAALQKQSEELLLEYDRLLEDNQILQTQALAFRG
ncbi:hypothetical protein GW17_00027630, partial [Ensete ventricosum]